MPSDSMPVPHYQQANPGSGLLACVRMVAATFGHQLTEQEIGQVVGSYGFGVPAGHLDRLRRFGYRVDQGRFTVHQLQTFLDAKVHPILFLAADQLPWTAHSGCHPLVLAEMSVKEVGLLDPTCDHGPIHLAKGQFLQSWRPYDQRAAILNH